MKYWKAHILFIFLGVGILSCDLNIQRTTSPSSKEGFNIFYVGRTFCKQNNLEVIKFSVEYPDYLLTDIAEPQYENYNYNAFFKWNDHEVQTEGISIAECTLEDDYFESSDAEKEKLSNELWKKVIEDYSEVFQFSNIQTGQKVFDNNKYFMFRANANIENPKPEAEFMGHYIMQTLIVESPNSNGDALVITFLANDDSEIKTYEDFATKGHISYVWKSLKFE